MGVPIIYRTAAENIATYNYEDLASGTGYIIFYGGGLQSTYNLESNSFYSNLIATKAATALTTSYVQALDIDFDVILNAPRTLKGYAIISCPLGARGTSNSPGSKVTMKYTAYIRKWDGTNETEIANAESTELQVTSGLDTINSGIKSVNILVPLTKFKKGETLRLTIVVSAKTNEAGGASSLIALGHDPKNRDDDGDVPGVITDICFLDATDTILEFHAPFRIDN